MFFLIELSLKFQIPVSKIRNELTDDDIKIYKYYNDIKPIDRTDFHQAHLQAILKASSGLSAEGQYTDWRQDWIDRNVKSEEKARLEQMKKMEEAKAFANYFNKYK